MDLSDVLTHLIIVFLAARLAAEVAERVRAPVVIAEIAAGVLIGPSALGLLGSDEFIRVLGELGIILLLFEVGRQMDLGELARVGGASLRVAFIGVAGPLAVGYPVMRAVGLESGVALFVAAGITATSVGLTARVFADLRMLASTEARTVLGAAVADDVIGLLVLTVVVGYMTGGDVSTGSILSLVSIAVGFVVVATAIGLLVVPRFLRGVSERARSDGTLMTIGLAFAFAVSRAASAARLAPIVGAFVAGLVVGRSEVVEDLHRRLQPIGQLLIPIFFLYIGIDTRVGVFADADVLGIAAALCVVAIATKLVAGLGISGSRADRLMVGLGMIPRGEVGLIFAGLGLRNGILDERTYGALVLVVLVTSIVTPSLMKRRIERARLRSAEEHASVIEPEGGWLSIGEREVELAAEAPGSSAGVIALRAALACSERTPGQRLLSWLSSVEAGTVWSDDARAALFALLREGNARSWRFLELSGMREKLFPLLGQGVAADGFSMDPLESAHWSVLSELRKLIATGADPAVRGWERAPLRDLVLLSALARSAFGSARDAGPRARTFAASVGLSVEDGELVGSLVGERTLLSAAAAKLDMGTEDSVLELAAHIETRDRARALYVLAVAENAMEPWERQRLDELFGLISEALGHPELIGSSARTLIEHRRALALERLGHVPGARQHLDAAPRRYLLAQGPAAIERHLRMLETPLGRHEARVHAEPGELRGTWSVHVAIMDRPGVLAGITGAFLALDVDIQDAFISTWHTGEAIDVFKVRAPASFDWEPLRAQIEREMAEHPSDRTQVRIEGSIEIDNASSPWHSVVEVQARDRAGLLHRVASALSRAGLEIHQATVSTRGQVAVDRFWVTAQGGTKLDPADERRLREAFEGRSGRGWRAPWASPRRRKIGTKS